MKDKIIYNRKIGHEEKEISGNTNGLSFLYHSLPGKLITPLLNRHFISRTYGRYVKSPRSVLKIRKFIKQYNVDVSEISLPLESYTSLNDFFIRQLKSSARPIDPEPLHLISAADSRLLIYDLSRQEVLPVKGYWYSLAKFVRNSVLAAEYEDGWCYVYRLAPCDYHRFCYIDSGSQDEVRRIRGVLHSVNPIALSSVKSLMAKNYREMTIMHTNHFGKVLHVEVGALMVGKVMLHSRGSYIFRKGEEKGWFEFGGSTIVQLFKKNAIQPDADILEHSMAGIETLVKMGEKIGNGISDISKKK